MKNPFKVPALMASCFLLVNASPGFAQTNVPAQKAFYCQAECFVVGTDGFSVYYAGLSRGISLESTLDAFQKMKSTCPDPDLLLNRTVLRIERQDRSYPYTLTRVRPQARFASTLAVPANSCKELPADQIPAQNEAWGINIGG